MTNNRNRMMTRTSYCCCTQCQIAYGVVNNE